MANQKLGISEYSKAFFLKSALLVELLNKEGTEAEEASGSLKIVNPL